MGGDDDGGGNVDANKLVNVIKNEFKMTIDIEKLIKEIDTVFFANKNIQDGSGEIEFDEFQLLMQNDGGNSEIDNFKDWFTFS